MKSTIEWNETLCLEVRKVRMQSHDRSRFSLKMAKLRIAFLKTHYSPLTPCTNEILTNLSTSTVIASKKWKKVLPPFVHCCCLFQSEMRRFRLINAGNVWLHLQLIDHALTPVGKQSFIATTLDFIIFIVIVMAPFIPIVQFCTKLFSSWSLSSFSSLM